MHWQSRSLLTLLALSLVVVGSAHEVDELGVGRTQDRAPRDEAARLEGLAEGQRARLGDDRLVEVEEGRGRAGHARHRRRAIEPRPWTPNHPQHRFGTAHPQPGPSSGAGRGPFGEGSEP